MATRLPSARHLYRNPQKGLIQKLVDSAGAEANAYLRLRAQGGADTVNTWEKMEEFYRVIASAVVGIGETVNTTLGALKQSGAVLPESAAFLIQGISTDLDRETKELVELHKQHEGLTGTPVNHDEQMQLIFVGTQYQEISTRINSLTSVSLMSLAESSGKAFSEAMQKRKEAEALAAPEAL